MPKAQVADKDLEDVVIKAKDEIHDLPRLYSKEKRLLRLIMPHQKRNHGQLFANAVAKKPMCHLSQILISRYIAKNVLLLSAPKKI